MLLPSLSEVTGFQPVNRKTIPYAQQQGIWMPGEPCSRFHSMIDVLHKILLFKEYIVR